MSGGKGGTRTAEQQIPQYIQDFAQQNLNRAKIAQQIGYMPNYGPQVAALSPQQQSAMQASNSAMQAFGLAPRDVPYDPGVPQAQEFAGGVRGYSSGNLFDQAVAELASRDPEQLAKYNQFYS